MTKLTNRNIELISICIDTKTKQKLDDYARVRHVSRSSAMRVLLNEILLKKAKQGEVIR